MTIAKIVGIEPDVPRPSHPIESELALDTEANQKTASEHLDAVEPKTNSVCSNTGFAACSNSFLPIREMGVDVPSQQT